MNRPRESVGVAARRQNSTVGDARTSSWSSWSSCATAALACSLAASAGSMRAHSLLAVIMRRQSSRGRDSNSWRGGATQRVRRCLRESHQRRLGDTGTHRYEGVASFVLDRRRRFLLLRPLRHSQRHKQRLCCWRPSAWSGAVSATTAANRTARLRRPQLACPPVGACMRRVCNAAPCCSPRLAHSSLLSQQRRRAPTQQHFTNCRYSGDANGECEVRRLAPLPRWQSSSRSDLRARLSASFGHLLGEVRLFCSRHPRRAPPSCEARLAKHSMVHASAHTCVLPGAYAQRRTGAV
jgi:hypothetical protein